MNLLVIDEWMASRWSDYLNLQCAWGNFFHLHDTSSVKISYCGREKKTWPLLLVILIARVIGSWAPVTCGNRFSWTRALIHYSSVSCRTPIFFVLLRAVVVKTHITRGEVPYIVPWQQWDKSRAHMSLWWHIVGDEKRHLFVGCFYSLLHQTRWPSVTWVMDTKRSWQVTPPLFYVTWTMDTKTKI